MDEVSSEDTTPGAAASLAPAAPPTSGPAERADPPAPSRWEGWVQTAEGLDPVTGLLPLTVGVVGGAALVVARLWRRLRRR